MSDLYQPNAIKAEVLRLAQGARDRYQAIEPGRELGRKIAVAVREREQTTKVRSPTDIVDIQILLAQLRSDPDHRVSQIADSAAQSFREQRTG